jgi:hypothetical protein
MRACLNLLFLLISVCGSFAQDSPELRGPSLGFVVDEAGKVVRPIHGIPGAAHIGAPLALTFDQMMLAPGSEYALFTRQGEIFHVNLETLESTLVAPGDWTRAAFSPGGRSAVLWRNEDRRIAILSGLPDEPVLAGTLGLAWLDQEPRFLAVSDAGLEVFLSASREEDATLYRLALNGSILPVATFPSISALVLTEDALWLAEGNEARVHVVRRGSGWSQVELVSQLPAEAPPPGALALSADGERLFMANRADRSVFVLSISTGEITTVPCPCEPSVFERMSASSVYRTTAADSGPVWLLDAGRSQPVMMFVPAPSGERESAGAEEQP